MDPDAGLSQPGLGIDIFLGSNLDPDPDSVFSGESDPDPGVLEIRIRFRLSNKGQILDPDPINFNPDPDSVFSQGSIEFGFFLGSYSEPGSATLDSTNQSCKLLPESQQTSRDVYLLYSLTLF